MDGRTFGKNRVKKAEPVHGLVGKTLRQAVECCRVNGANLIVIDANRHSERVLKGGDFTIVVRVDGGLVVKVKQAE